MSIRISTKERSKSDFYLTPRGVARTVSEQITKSPFWLSPKYKLRVLDPGAGTGIWGEEIRRVYPSAFIHGVEIETSRSHNPAYDQWTRADFSRVGNFIGQYDLIIGNPPFSLAEDFIYQSHELLYEHGWLVFFLRMQFLEGIDRSEGLFKELQPRYVFILPRRVAFKDEAGKLVLNGVPYAIFAWAKGAYNSERDTIIRWLKWENVDD